MTAAKTLAATALLVLLAGCADMNMGGTPAASDLDGSMDAPGMEDAGGEAMDQNLT